MNARARVCVCVCVCVCVFVCVCMHVCVCVCTRARARVVFKSNSIGLKETTCVQLRKNKKTTKAGHSAGDDQTDLQHRCEFSLKKISREFICFISYDPRDKGIAIEGEIAEIRCNILRSE
jgi:hypothetical protein